jgi:predicted RNase H-like HicB family nuclease
MIPYMVLSNGGCHVAKKDLAYYMGLPYTITLKRGTGNGEEYWIARVLELPHCMTHGATPEEALRDIQDAKREWLASNLEDGLPIPEPARFTGQYHLRMPPSLHEALALKSESEDVSLNQYIVTALARAVGYAEPAKKHRTTVKK